MNSENRQKNLYKEMLIAENIKLSLILFVLWFIVSYVYYGLIYVLPSIYEKLELTKKSSEILSSESYDRIVSDIIISCIFEIPSNILNGILPIYFEKKYIVISSFIGSCLFSFLSCFMSPLIPIFSSINKGFINTAFTMLYVYTSEAYPTYMRTTSLGTCNFFSRIGGFTTPFICEYLLGLNFQVPFIGFGFSSLLGIILTFLLPKISEKNIF
jgi:putative MFS transporter